MRLAWPGLLWLPHILLLLNFLVWAGRFSPPSPHYGRCCYSRCQRHCHQRHSHQRIHRYPPLMHVQFIELIFIEPSLLNSSRIYARERAPSKRNGLRMAGEFGSAATWERWRSGGLGAQIRGWRFFFLVGGRPRLPPPPPPLLQLQRNRGHTDATSNPHPCRNLFYGNRRGLQRRRIEQRMPPATKKTPIGTLSPGEVLDWQWRFTVVSATRRCVDNSDPPCIRTESASSVLRG